MTLEEIYYIGQTVAVIAIVASLIFVGLQVRQSARTTRAQMSANVNDRFVALLSQLTSDKELANVFRAIAFSGELIEEDEKGRLLVWFDAWLHMYHSAFVGLRDGFIDPRTLEFVELTTHWFFSKPLFAAEWRRNTDQLPKEFVDYVNARAPVLADRVAATNARSQRNSP